MCNVYPWPKHLLLSLLITVAYNAGIALTESVSVNGQNNANTKNCQSFYIYDWPNEQMSSWPNPDTKLKPKRKKHPLDYDHVDGLNFGAGNVSNPSRGVFVTKNSDQMYHTIMSRLRVHPQRTMDRNKACLRVIPMDLGISSFFDKATGRFVMHAGCYHTVREGQQLMTQAVAEAPLWGHEMMFISSMGTMFTLNCSTILYPCVNCTRLQFETPDTSNDAYIKYAQMNGHKITYRWFSIPHVSNIHLSEEMSLQNLPWKQREETENPRTHLVVLWASPGVQRRKAVRIRLKLHKDCALFPTQCYVKPIKNRYLPGLMQTGSTVEQLYGNATFCLMPPGDGPTRKGIFDSLLMGCIPVMFDWFLMSKTYEWYFTKEKDRECFVYVQGENYIHDKEFNIIPHLANISAAEILKKQQCIEEIAHTVSYAIPPSRFKPYIGFGGGKTRYFVLMSGFVFGLLVLYSVCVSVCV